MSNLTARNLIRVTKLPGVILKRRLRPPEKRPGSEPGDLAAGREDDLRFPEFSATLPTSGTFPEIFCAFREVTCEQGCSLLSCWHEPGSLLGQSLSSRPSWSTPAALTDRVHPRESLLSSRVASPLPFGQSISPQSPPLVPSRGR